MYRRSPYTVFVGGLIVFLVRRYIVKVAVDWRFCGKLHVEIYIYLLSTIINFVGNRTWKIKTVIIR